MEAQTASWSKELLIAAVHKLRIEYLQRAEACIALMIARYCNLLTNQASNTQEKRLWQKQAELWTNCYQLNRSISPSQKH